MIYDLAIVGGGPAGCSAAVTAANRNLKTILFDPGDFAPALRKSRSIKNYLGFPEISGKDLMAAFVRHMEQAGTEVVTEKILNVMALNGHFYLSTPGSVYEAGTVLLAVGVPHSRGLEGEKDLIGQGVSYCATCDGNFYRGRAVGVLCTVPSQWHEIEFLAGLASDVTAWISFEPPARIPANVAIRRALPGAVARRGKQLAVTDGDGIKYVDGLFILRETDPVARLMPEIALDGRFIRTDRQQRTSVPGVFAAGDCTGEPWQINKAAGEGQVAVFGAAAFLREQKP